ncbi:D-Ala-D-Ala carboxypeptidase family metallohydrolase [Gallalistipes aquisgranensis]|uniref:D-Ala-D-Ala carboxypeptidase family metallohydrolase n=1 Tax=Gallalistipes aquisgranensis TaxID=2779358 RepID=UPI001CF8B968|nr:D-Ala-D-Ala carboxypeptidase family metallohydrolase [Gallalistipes aquisgranensis]
MTSGFRSPRLNEAVNGVPSSQHVKGEAADITVGNPEDNRKLFELIRTSGLAFDQLIDERNYTWLHVSYSDNNRKQILHLK